MSPDGVPGMVQFSLAENCQKCPVRVAYEDKSRPESSGLNSCPLCGGRATTVRFASDRWRVQCNTCGCETGEWSSSAVAIGKWNERLEEGKQL